MKLTVLGDLHYFRRLVPPWSLLGKRMVGQANVWFNRGGRFHRSILPRVVARMQEIQPDVLILTGDLTSTALPGEFEDVVRALQPLLATTVAVAVPGNHDRYTPVAGWTRRFERMVAAQLLAEQHTSDAEGAGLVAGAAQKLRPHTAQMTVGEKVKETAAGAAGLKPTGLEYPQWLRLGRWRLLALDAAVPRVMTSRGWLGPRQLGAAREALAELGEDEGLIVLCHYPMVLPTVRQRWQHRLADARALREVLEPVVARRRGKVQTVYIHGHIHRPWLEVYADGPGAGLVDVNAGAQCLVSRADRFGQGFWQLDLPEDPRGAIVARLHRLVGGEGEDAWEVRERVVELSEVSR